MLKIFLVEDEFIVREGIKKKIDWEAHGYEFCGEASDGELAFPMIQKLKPDIVITDIKMPFMDGLTLSKLIKKEFPWMEIIILTGHEKFEYAKEAIKLGVAEYLSKPISGNELLVEVDALAVKIEEKRNEREIREKYANEMQENFLKERNELFSHLVTGTLSLPEILDITDRLKMDLSSIWFNILLLDIQSTKHTSREFANYMPDIEQELKGIEDERQLIIFDRNLEGKAFLFKADSAEELRLLQDSYIEKIKAMLDGREDIRYFGGVGVPVNRLSELPKSFEKAGRAFAHRYFVEGNHIIDGNEEAGAVYVEMEDFNISNVDTKQIDRNKIREFLKQGAREEVVYFVEEFFVGMNKNFMESNIFRQYITMDVYFCVVDFVASIQMPKEEIEPLDIASGVLQNSHSAINYVVKIIGRAIDLRDKVVSNKYGNVVEEIMNYIEQNFASEELSLNQVASHVNFSPNHLSMVFSQQTGQTFIKYLTDFRMNKAKELLRCSNKRSSVIAQEVGYKDPHYFSYLFKKTQNMTPTQYREGKTSEEDE